MGSGAVFLWWRTPPRQPHSIKSNLGYIIDKANKIKITHLLYMDDIKLFAPDRQQLEHLLKLTEKFSADIYMTFGTDKCKINCILKGKHTHTEPLNLELQEGTIDSMQAKDTYKYLGYIQNTAIDHKEIKNTLKIKYKQRLNKILKTQLSGRNKIKAVNTYAIPILTYSFGIIRWSDTDLEALNTATRTACYKHNIHHIHSAVERFTIKRKQGGRGFIDIKNLHYTQIDNLRKYFKTKANTSPLHKAIVSLPHSGTPLQFNNDQFDPQNKIIKIDNKIEKWKSKALHENDSVKLYWDRDIVTDRTILSNRPDMTLTIKSEKTTYLIDVAVPNTNNLKQKHTEKIQKYIPLADEIKQMWHQNTQPNG
ncbi:uncharacterized protein LOC121737855 [Aricia agestis]|uniref:uncharacterized protein LOC121737855 n=1 Tax=Aricia agestis TaxID=91739 RepID=UPI001C20AB20|nr:uncharacterized protein LOC121737855 [Aricia agestis]